MDRNDKPYKSAPAHRETDKTNLIAAPEERQIFQKHLTDHQRTNQLLIDWIYACVECSHPRQAAVMVGQKPGWGTTQRRNTRVHMVIEELTELARRDRRISKSEIVERVKECIGPDIAEFQRPDGSWIENVHEVDPEIRRAIESFEVKNEYDSEGNFISGKIIKVKLYNKLKAAELLGREVQLFKQHSVQEHTGSVSLEARLRESDERARQRLEEKDKRRVIDVTPTEGRNLKAPPIEE